MAHELDRVIRAFASRAWAIEDGAAERIMAALMLRAENGPRAMPFSDEPQAQAPVAEQQGRVAVMNLMGAIVPRASAVRDVSSSFASMEKFQAAFRTAARDASISAIVINVDSPGGMVDLVPETAAMIRAERREGRPIVAVANTIAASAAYWIASQADTFYATPSGMVGSIGVRAMHMDRSAEMEAKGVRVTHISAGPRKTEISPYAPLDESAQKALQEEVNASYTMFVRDVARARGVAESVVRADPETADAHMGGGRAYHAAAALKLGMIDGIKTLDDVIAEVSRGAGRRGLRAERARLSLI